MASMDIDDLIASFKSSTNISQEAMDLAALQAQLNAALMGGRPAQCPTTPTMTSMQLAPEQSGSFYQGAYGQKHSGKRDRKGTMVSARPTMTRHHSEWERQRQSELDEQRDMDMIESSLLGSEADYQSNAYAAWNNGMHSNATPMTSPPVSEPSSLAAYAAMDPFFAAQLQTAQQPFGQPRAGSYGFSSMRSTYASS